MSHPPGLAGTVYPNFFYNLAFFNLTNCFTFMTGFADTFMDTFIFLGVRALRPEDLGWTSLQTKEEWIHAVKEYFNPELPTPQSGSTADRYGRYGLDPALPYMNSLVLCDSTGLHWTPPSVPAICFPLIQGAHDYHRAVYNGMYWLEQAGKGGPINAWASLEGMIDDIYSRGDDAGKFYVNGSHFFFSKRIT